MRTIILTILLTLIPLYPSYAYLIDEYEACVESTVHASQIDICLVDKFKVIETQRLELEDKVIKSASDLYNELTKEHPKFKFDETPRPDVTAKNAKVEFEEYRTKACSNIKSYFPYSAHYPEYEYACKIYITKQRMEFLKTFILDKRKNNDRPNN